MPAAAANRTLGELAVRFGCELQGDPATIVRSVATLQGGTDAIGYAASPAWRAALRQTSLAAVILDETLAADCPVAALVHPNPHATFARVAALLHPRAILAPGVHATAVIAPDAQVDPSARIGPLAVVESGAHFVKTSTGFSTGGATTHDIQLMRECVGEKFGVKASGGIRDATVAQGMIQAGATRLGTSAGVAIVKGLAGSGSY